MSAETPARDAIAAAVSYETGRVDYDLLIRDGLLEGPLRYVRDTAETKFADDKAKFAFYMNAYNITCLEAICDKLRADAKFAGNVSGFSKFAFFFWKAFTVATRRMSLFALENKVLRPRFKDARVHFAINCCSISCPFLHPQLLDPATLDDDLDMLARSFINDQGGVKLSDDRRTAHLSSIFKWYRGDFEGEAGSLQKYIAKYWAPPQGSDLPGEFPQDVAIAFQSYDWHINSASSL